MYPRHVWITYIICKLSPVCCDRISNFYVQIYDRRNGRKILYEVECNDSGRRKKNYVVWCIMQYTLRLNIITLYCHTINRLFYIGKIFVRAPGRCPSLSIRDLSAGSSRFIKNYGFGVIWLKITRSRDKTCAIVKRSGHVVLNSAGGFDFEIFPIFVASVPVVVMLWRKRVIAVVGFRNEFDFQP